MASFQLSISLSQNHEHEIMHEGDSYYFEENNEGLVIGVFQNKEIEQVVTSLIQDPNLFVNSLELGFSFLFWNKSSGEISLYRDFFGIKPLFFSIINSTLFCGTSIGYLAEKNNRKINKEAVKGFFSSTFDDEPIDSSTFFENVFRVLPGHKCTITNNGFSQNIAIKLSETTSGDFKQIFEASILKINKNYTKLGSHLSGGLDSSSIVGLLQDKKIEAYYFDTGSGSNNEKKLAESYADSLPNCNFNILEYSKNTLESAKESCKLTFLPELLVLPLETFDIISKKASETNIEAVFSGHGGDTIVGYGWDYLDDLFENKKYDQLAKELEKYFELNKNNAQVASNYGFRFTKENFCNYFIIKLLKKNFSFKRLLEIYLNKNTSKVFKISSGISLYFKPLIKKTLSFSWLIDSKTNEIDIKAKFSSIISPKASKYQKSQIDLHFVRLGIHALEVFDVIHSKYNQEPVYPFLSKKLLESSLNTPLADKYYNGHGRGLLRNAMRSILPDDILYRNTKESFNEAFYRYFYALNDQFTIKENSLVWSLTEKKTFEKSLSYLLNSNFTDKQKTHHLWYCSKVLSVAIWLETLDLE